MWDREGRRVIYHRKFAQAEGGRSFVGIVDVDGGNRVEVPLPTGFDGYGHFTTGGADTLVTDGYCRADADPGDARHGRWISLVDPDWATATMRWRPLCRHGSSWASQDAHPHPVFDHAGGSVLFTSDATGRRNVYRYALG